MLPPALAIILLILFIIASFKWELANTVAGKVFVILLVLAVMVQTQKNVGAGKPNKLLAGLLLAGLAYFVLAKGTTNLGAAGYLFLLLGIALFVLFSIGS